MNGRLDTTGTLRDAANRVFSPIHLWRDAERLADAYLAEHPADDDEPITEDWLKSVGLASLWYDDVLGTPPHDPSPLGFAVESTGRAMIRLGTSISYLGNVDAKTRGQVRRLCAALGIPLTCQSGK